MITMNWNKDSIVTFFINWNAFSLVIYCLRCTTNLVVQRRCKLLSLK